MPLTMSSSMDELNQSKSCFFFLISIQSYQGIKLVELVDGYQACRTCWWCLLGMSRAHQWMNSINLKVASSFLSPFNHIRSSSMDELNQSKSCFFFLSPFNHIRVSSLLSLLMVSSGDEYSSSMDELNQSKSCFFFLISIQSYQSIKLVELCLLGISRAHQWMNSINIKVVFSFLSPFNHIRDLQAAVTRREPDFDGLADESRELLDVSREARISMATSQLVARFQSVLLTTKELVRKCDQQVEDHILFNQKLAEAEDWVKNMKNKLAEIVQMPSNNTDALNLKYQKNKAWKIGPLLSVLNMICSGEASTLLHFRSYRNCNNCHNSQLTPDHIYPAILVALYMADINPEEDIHTDKAPLLAGIVIRVHGSI
ncbi:hypothetical protein LAZ67_22001522 [Cordylochernes scorpioides]|uniref:Uncharacterized protein n=1 Tax=Cordylochernes scorpioides TaxID=51811 RepID=A0ABY6LQW8_9ARAC|nr:hypothetical protein LAZ67_22001522 [Cordylochernes scorpioides]